MNFIEKHAFCLWTWQHEHCWIVAEGKTTLYLSQGFHSIDIIGIVISACTITGELKVQQGTHFFSNDSVNLGARYYFLKSEWIFLQHYEHIYAQVNGNIRIVYGYIYVVKAFANWRAGNVNQYIHVQRTVILTIFCGVKIGRRYSLRLEKQYLALSLNNHQGKKFLPASPLAHSSSLSFRQNIYFRCKFFF